MKVGNYEQMMAHLKDPFNPSELRARVKELEPREDFAIGGGIIQGENLGTREGFKRVELTSDKFRNLYDKFQKDKNNLGTDLEFSKILNKKYVTNKGGDFNTSNVYKRRADLGIKTPVKGSQASPLIMKQAAEKRDYLSNLIEKLNQEEKFYTREQVSSMMEKKFKLKPKYNASGYKINQFSSDNYPEMKNLSSIQEKLEKTLKNMLSEDKPLNDFWYDALAKRAGVEYKSVFNFLPTSKRYKSIKDQGADALKNRFNKKATHSFLKEMSFKEQLKTGLEMQQGQPIFIGLSKVNLSTPKHKVMDFAKRSWNLNKGNGAIKFYNKNGKPITWEFGRELPYDKVYFTYNNKKYSAKTLSDVNLLKQDFPEVYENQTALNKLRAEEISDPLNKNKKISIGKLIERNQINNYNWKPTGVIDIVHGSEGVKNSPFNDLSFNTRDLNTLQNNIMKSKNLNEAQKTKINSLINKVSGAGDPVSIVGRQTNIAKTGAEFNTIFSKIVDTMQNKGRITQKELGQLLNVYKKQKGETLQTFAKYFCGRKKASVGGRINLREAGSPSQICSTEEMLSNMERDKQVSQGPDQKAAAEARTRLLKAGRSLGKILGTVVAPVDVAIELAFAGPSLLRGDIQGAINASSLGFTPLSKTGMDQVAEKFGTNSTEYALYAQEDAIQKKMMAVGELDKLISQSRGLGIIPEESGEFKKGIGRDPQEEALQKSFANTFINLSKIDQQATKNFQSTQPLLMDKEKNVKALQNVADFSSSLQPYAPEIDTGTVGGFIKSGGDVFKKEMPSRFALPQYEEKIKQLEELRPADFPVELQSQLAAYEKSQMPSQEEIDLMSRQQFESPLDFKVPYDQLRYKGFKEGGRINFANGGRLTFSDGSPKDPSKRKFLQKTAIGGGVAGGLATGLINLLDLFKGGSKATKATEAVRRASRAEEIFFDLVRNVKNKGVMREARFTGDEPGGVIYEHAGVKVIDDEPYTRVEFETDKGAPAVIEYRKPGYDVDPNTQTTIKDPGGFEYEGQEVGRIRPNGDVDIDFEEEIIDEITNVEKIAKGD